MNAINRSMGMPDPYPFVLAPAAIDKLYFVHRVIAHGGVARGDVGASAAAVVPELEAACGTAAGGIPSSRDPHMVRERSLRRA